MTQLQSQVTQVIIQMIFWSGIIAPLVMRTFWPWERSELGWSIVAKTLALSLALLMTVLAYYFGPAFLHYAVLTWFSIIMLAAVPVILWWRVWVIYKNQRDGARHP